MQFDYLYQFFDYNSVVVFYLYLELKDCCIFVLFCISTVQTVCTKQVHMTVAYERWFGKLACFWAAL